MPNVLLILQRDAIIQSLMAKLCNNLEIRLMVEPDHRKALVALNSQAFKAVLIEVAESGRYDISYCLELCRELRITVPDCKLLLMCSEQDEPSVERVIQAKSDKSIDDFVFFDVTVDYLASKLLSL